MIKVIASDMDGTLLNDRHQLAPETLEAIQEACEAGIRFIVATGRNFSGAMEELKGADLTCDYLVGSGAEVRNPQGEVMQTLPLDMKLCREVYESLRQYPVSIIFCTNHYDYRIGDVKEVEESFLREMKAFHVDQNIEEEELKKTPLYQRMKKKTKIISDFEELKREEVPVYKIFLYSGDIPMLREMSLGLEKNPRIAVASSFETNLEITDIRAQKGPVLRRYIESLGYKMEEIMVFGDSMNDYSMLSMDFGATVAMENAMPEVKKAARYVTKSNEESGVAYTIHKMLKKYREAGKIPVL